VRSVYGQEVSGIRPFVAIPRILALLARAAVSRMRDGRVEGSHSLAAGAAPRP
jgi:hypothetical protein